MPNDIETPYSDIDNYDQDIDDENICCKLIVIIVILILMILFTFFIQNLF